MSRDDESSRSCAPVTGYDYWSDSSKADKVLVPKCVAIITFKYEKLCEFVVTDTDAEFNIYSFCWNAKKIRIKNQDRAAGWRANMGMVHIGQCRPIGCK